MLLRVYYGDYGALVVLEILDLFPLCLVTFLFLYFPSIRLPQFLELTLALIFVPSKSQAPVLIEVLQPQFRRLELLFQRQLLASSPVPRHSLNRNGFLSSSSAHICRVPTPYSRSTDGFLYRCMLLYIHWHCTCWN